MNELNKNSNELNQTVALTRFRALNFIEDLQRSGGSLAEALRQASLQAWPDQNGDYYAVRSVFTQLSDGLFANLGMESMRKHGREARESMLNT